MRLTRPIVPLDPGWLFVIAGLVVIAAALLIPPQEKLVSIQHQVTSLRTRESLAMDRLRAYSDFLAALDDRDPTLIRRLAAAHLNLIREGDQVVLIAESAEHPVTDWIEATLASRPVLQIDAPESGLSSLVTGPYRHWILAGAAGCLFVGLLIGPGRDGDATETSEESANVAEERSSDPLVSACVSGIR